MSPDEKATIFATVVSAQAGNKAIVRLHALLAAKGVINNAEVEALRHLHLRDFDLSFDELQNEVGRAALASDRAVLDKLWQSAVQVPLRGP